MRLAKSWAISKPAVDRSLYEEVRPLASEAELDRRSQAGGGRLLADILRDLESHR